MQGSTKTKAEPKAKAAKAAPKAKAAKPDTFSKAPKAVPKAKVTEKTTEKTNERGFDINERYSKKTDLEHVLLRPDTYIGGTDKIEREEWVWDSATSTVVQRKINYSPGLYKIFDEVLVNARDHTVRDETCNRIRVDINPENGEISVENNGTGIPIEWHDAADCYLAEMIFGMFKSGENFSDDEKKTVGGRNGFGAKLANAFSLRFHIDTVDKVTGKRYTQLWENNMSVRHDAAITSCPKAGYTRITFLPDYKRLGESAINEPGFLGLISRRVYDMAACTREDVLIYLNGEKLSVRTFPKYVDLFLGTSKTDRPRVTAQLVDESDRSDGIKEGLKEWDITVALSEDGGFKQFSLVNGIATSQGGTHVAYIRDQIVRKVGKLIREKKPDEDIKPGFIRENLWIFVNAVVVNPSFSSQTKEMLSTEPTKFDFKHSISDDIIANIEKRLQISKRAMGVAGLREHSALKKIDGRKKTKIYGILKLEDAQQAGKRRSNECTLILTEGDSAKTMAMDGLQIIGRDLYGVFPLRGKFINARNASVDQLTHNAEYKALMEIMGFREGADYMDDKMFASLRYGCMMLLTDQDVDGYHIKGLIFNWIIAKWPSLLSRPGFFKCFITPIVRLQPSSATSKKQPVFFFNMSEYETYRKKHGTAGMTVRYLKGLGTSEKQEAREYFADFTRFAKEYRPIDVSVTKIQFEHAFSDKFADWRKEWLGSYDEHDLYDYKSPVFALDSFIDKELKHFSLADNTRSIGHSIDGLKVSQRKVLWGLRKLGLWDKTKKVLALAGDVSSASSYHHGEKSLMDTMIGMAQKFVDSNNINLLYPSGQFGSRLESGKDAADPRYIFTKLNDITRKIVRSEDDNVLRYEQDDEGRMIEPKYFAPIIPMVLINGCQGIGTGYSTTVPMYNPLDVIDRYIAILASSSTGEGPLVPLVPWYNNFCGTIEPVPEQDGLFDSFGCYQRLDDTTIQITEVPVGQSFDGYKAFIEDHLIENLPTGITDQKKISAAQVKHFIKDYLSDTTPSRCNFKLTFSDKAILDDMLEDPKAPKGVFKKLRLTSRLSTKNMYLFGTDGAIKKFNSPDEVIEYHRGPRYQTYIDRKQSQLADFDAKIAALTQKQRFIQLVLDGKIDVRNQTKQAVAAAILANGIVGSVGGSSDSEGPAGENDNDGLTAEMKMLLKISLYDMTQEEVAKFMGKIEDLRLQRTRLFETPVEQIWLSELRELRDATVEHLRYSSLDVEDAQLEKLLQKNGRAKAGPIKAAAARPAKAKAKAK
jgi:DNA topoisomerase-2